MTLYPTPFQDTLLNLEERPEKKEKRYSEIQASAQRINELLTENMQLFNMQDNQNSEIWMNYVAFIDSLMEESLFKTIACRYLYIKFGLNLCTPTPFNHTLESR